MYRLGELLFDPLEAIVLGRQAYFSDWVVKAYDILVRREAPITEEESEVIGHLTTVRLFNIRHNLHWELGHCRDDSPAHEDGDTEAKLDEEAGEDGEPPDGGDDPIPLSEVDDVVRDCLLQRFKEEFALIEAEETKRHYSEYEEDSDEEGQQEQEREEGADDEEGGETTTRSKLLDGDEEEALEEYLNNEDEEDGDRRTSMGSVSAGLRSPWDPRRLSFGGADGDDDERTRVGSADQRSDAGGDTSWSEDDEEHSPVNSVASGEGLVDEEDETSVPCINLLGYDSPPLQSGVNALGIDFATLANFRRIGELESSVIGESRQGNPTLDGERTSEVFRRPASSPEAEGSSTKDGRRHQQTVRQFGGSLKEGGWPTKGEAALAAGSSHSSQGSQDHSSHSEQPLEDADSRDDTLCRVA